MSGKTFKENPKFFVGLILTLIIWFNLIRFFASIKLRASDTFHSVQTELSYTVFEKNNFLNSWLFNLFSCYHYFFEEISIGFWSFYKLKLWRNNFNNNKTVFIFQSVINVLMQLRKVCNHPNLFEARATVAPFVADPIQVQNKASSHKFQKSYFFGKDFEHVKLLLLKQLTAFLLK